MTTMTRRKRIVLLITALVLLGAYEVVVTRELLTGPDVASPHDP